MSGAARLPTVALVDVIVALSQLIERHADDAVQVRVLAAFIWPRAWRPCWRRVTS
jgi:hypothetical protein